MALSKSKMLIYLFLLLSVFIIGSGSKKSVATLFIPLVFAHCDTMNGPVIKAAQKALETGKVNLVLPWVQKKDEAEITKAFENTLVVRKLSPKAKELADRYFFETLVRVHRAGEGEPYTGLKEGEVEIEPGIEAADAALETGSCEELIKKMTGQMSGAIRAKFNEAMENKKHSDESVEAGREYVKAYVEFIHFVEKIHSSLSSSAHQHE